MRDRVMALLQAGVAAADPGRAVAAHMADVLADPPGPGGRWTLIALGKAGRAMAAAALEALPEAEALVITNRGNDAPLARARVLASGHPVPDAAGEAAAREVEALLGAAGPADRVLALISGGGSAMLPAPVDGVSLAEKQEANRLLLGSGADITQTNLIRQALSRLKGGGWLRATRAPVTALILSDVPGDDLRVIASGPTVAPIGPVAEAAATARRLGIWDRLPAAVRAALSRERAEAALPEARNILRDAGCGRRAGRCGAGGGCRGLRPCASCRGAGGRAGDGACLRRRDDRAADRRRDGRAQPGTGAALRPRRGGLAGAVGLSGDGQRRARRAGRGGRRDRR
jgi:glycerate 2-kinase